MLCRITHQNPDTQKRMHFPYRAECVGSAMGPAAVQREAWRAQISTSLRARKLDRIAEIYKTIFLFQPV